MNKPMLYILIFMGLMLSGCEKEPTLPDSSLFEVEHENEAPLQDPLQKPVDNTGLEASTPTNPPDSRIDTLQQTLTDLITQVEAIQAAQNASIEKNTSSIDLQQRVSELESRLDALNKKVNSANRTSRSAKTEAEKSAPVTPEPKVQLTPPFVIVGTESRGGETFLAVVPRHGQSLDQITLLRERDYFGIEWQLRSLQDNKAVFVVSGQEYTIKLP